MLPFLIPGRSSPYLAETSGAMFDRMHALLARKCYRSGTGSLFIFAPVEPNITSNAMPGNMEAMFGHVRGGFYSSLRRSSPYLADTSFR